MTNAVSRPMNQLGKAVDTDGLHARRPQPRVSIGLPVYNGERFLAKTLDSLLAQSFDDFEIIVSDNASTDTTAEIVAEYAERDFRIRYSKNARNLGASYNYNRVLALASGEYFKWIGADDLIRPEFLAICVDALDTNPVAAVAYSKAAFIDGDDHVIYVFDDIMEFKPWSKQPVKRTSQMLEAVLIDGHAATVPIFGLARTNALRAIRPLGNYYACDQVAVVELALQGEFCEIPQVLAFYRRHEGSSSYGPRLKVKQQNFYDPNVTGRFRLELQLRRRYLEMFRAIARADLKTSERLILALSAVRHVAHRAARRARFELQHGRLSGSPSK